MAKKEIDIKFQDLTLFTNLSKLLLFADNIFTMYKYLCTRIEYHSENLLDNNVTLELLCDLSYASRVLFNNKNDFDATLNSINNSDTIELLLSNQNRHLLDFTIDAINNLQMLYNDINTNEPISENIIKYILFHPVFTEDHKINIELIFSHIHHAVEYINEKEKDKPCN